MKLSLSTTEILDKVFAHTPRGYSPFEVDEYLDKILLDYQKVEENFLLSKKEYKAQAKKIEELESRLAELELENGKLKSRLKNIKDSDEVTTDNIDLIKRINVLEKWIYNHGGYPKNIR